MIFDPYDLDLDVTPASVRRQLRLKEWTSAIVLAFRLYEHALTQEVLETVPHKESESPPNRASAQGLKPAPSLNPSTVTPRTLTPLTLTLDPQTLLPLTPMS